MAGFRLSKIFKNKLFTHTISLEITGELKKVKIYLSR